MKFKKLRKVLPDDKPICIISELRPSGAKYNRKQDIPDCYDNDKVIRVDAMGGFTLVNSTRVVFPVIQLQSIK